MPWCSQSTLKSNRQQDSVPGPFVSDLHEPVASFPGGILGRWSTTTYISVQTRSARWLNRDSSSVIGEVGNKLQTPTPQRMYSFAEIRLEPRNATMDFREALEHARLSGSRRRLMIEGGSRASRAQLILKPLINALAGLGSCTDGFLSISFREAAHVMRNSSLFFVKSCKSSWGIMQREGVVKVHIGY
ncbi:hypothetical protein K440DRAFT_85490 [Wilcoxina mikolae CBS 423.85]|nr:hypothetical protein K440DRAFT_85490 [Wilcoxina mikolae CBS 423.85]